jgi:hypothetical protein
MGGKHTHCMGFMQGAVGQFSMFLGSDCRVRSLFTEKPTTVYEPNPLSALSLRFG